jgi:hypothetical protein
LAVDGRDVAAGVDGMAKTFFLKSRAHPHSMTTSHPEPYESVAEALEDAMSSALGPYEIMWIVDQDDNIVIPSAHMRTEGLQ